MKKKTAALLSSCAAIAVCSSLIVGSTYALFTSEDKVNIAVTAGQVKLTAWVDTDNVKSVSTLDGGEALGTFSSVENGYAINNIVPGDEFTFTVKAENESTVSTLYRTVIKLEDTELASALVVTIAGVEYEGLLSYTGVWAELAAKKDPADLEVKIAFPNSDEYQNDLQNKGTTISVTVEGVQANAGYEVGGEPTVVTANAPEIKEPEVLSEEEFYAKKEEYANKAVALYELDCLKDFDIKSYNSPYYFANDFYAQFEGMSFEETVAAVGEENLAYAIGYIRVMHYDDIYNPLSTTGAAAEYMWSMPKAWGIADEAQYDGEELVDCGATVKALVAILDRHPEYRIIGWLSRVYYNYYSEGADAKGAIESEWDNNSELYSYYVNSIKG